MSYVNCYYCVIYCQLNVLLKAILRNGIVREHEMMYKLQHHKIAQYIRAKGRSHRYNRIHSKVQETMVKPCL